MIELLVTIAIIAILAVVLIPWLLDARDRAEVAGAQAYVRDVYLAALSHVAADTVSPTTGSCTPTYASGDFTVAEPRENLLTSCSVAWDADERAITVSAVTRNGTTVHYP